MNNREGKSKKYIYIYTDADSAQFISVSISYQTHFKLPVELYLFDFLPKCTLHGPRVHLKFRFFPIRAIIQIISTMANEKTVGPCDQHSNACLTLQMDSFHV